MSENNLKGQLELGIGRSREKDRNFHLGGRSFYFFDFDDNIAFLSTPLILFHKETRAEMRLSSAEFAKYHQIIGQAGPLADYEVDYCDDTGTFRCFRDHSQEELRRLGRRGQIFVEDVAEALGFHDSNWKGPSWECFYHASFNQRPLSVITARGHHPETIKEGIRQFVRTKALPLEPNYLAIYPVNHKPTRAQLQDSEFTASTAVLKQRAIRASVELAIQRYGYSPHHRFGMSDDDPKNIQLIVEEMTRLKSDYPEISFFMIETHNGNFIKHEITLSGMVGQLMDHGPQLSLFAEEQKTPSES